MVEIAQRFFARIWNVSSDFLWAKLGVTSSDFEFLNVYRGVNVVLDKFL